MRAPKPGKRKTSGSALSRVRLSEASEQGENLQFLSEEDGPELEHLLRHVLSNKQMYEAGLRKQLLNPQKAVIKSSEGRALSSFVLQLARYVFLALCQQLSKPPRGALGQQSHSKPLGRGGRGKK